MRAAIGILVASGLGASPVMAQTGAQPAEAMQAPATQASKGAQPFAQAKRSAKVSRYRPDRFAGRAGSYYRLVWGVDSLTVKWGESGEVIRFSYRVLDAEKAKVLNDKKNEPSLIDPKAGVKLVVPSLENVGQLRQSTTPENGKSYWMVFSNKGRLVKLRPRRRRDRRISCGRTGRRLAPAVIGRETLYNSIRERSCQYSRLPLCPTTSASVRKAKRPCAVGPLFS
jgi:hypothetical protein